MELQGWRVNAASVTNLNPADTSHDRSLQFRLCACSGVNGPSTPLLTRDVAYSLLAVSVKQFHIDVVADYIEDDLRGAGCPLLTRSSDTCLALRHVYPQYNAMGYQKDEGKCFLQRKLSLSACAAIAEVTSYLSWYIRKHAWPHSCPVCECT